MSPPFRSTVVASGREIVYALTRPDRPRFDLEGPAAGNQLLLDIPARSRGFHEVNGPSVNDDEFLEVFQASGCYPNRSVLRTRRSFRFEIAAALLVGPGEELLFRSNRPMIATVLRSIEDNVADAGEAILRRRIRQLLGNRHEGHIS